MFCPNCGKEIEIPNQRFCQNCGSDLSIVSETPQSMPSPQPAPKVPNSQFMEQKPVKIKGPYSKRSLGFGIASLIIAMTLFNIGSSFIMFPTYGYGFYLISIAFIIFGIMHIVGLIFGIASRINSQQAEKLESINTAMKAGSVLGVIGIILNSILMVAAFVIVGLIG